MSEAPNNLPAMLDPYDIAHPSHVDPHAHLPLPEPTDLDRQIAAAKNHKVAFINPPRFQASTVPACKVCGSWPCLQDAQCPDYLAIWEKGLLYFPKEKRLESLKEAAKRLTWGSRA